MNRDRSLYAEQERRSRRSLAWAGGVITAILCVEVALVVPMLWRDKGSRAMGLMVIDQGEKVEAQIRQFVGTPVVSQPTAPTAVAKPVQEAKAQASKATPTHAQASILSFNGRPLRKSRTLHMLVTAYSPDARSCGASADGITASGYSVWTNGTKLVAADTRILPFKSIITIPGYNDGLPVPVLDRGGKIKGNRLDVLYPTHEIAMQWGKRWMDVDVWEYAD